MPSLARVMPVISLFIALFPSLIALVARRAFLGVTVAVIFEYLLDNLGLEFAIGAFGDLGQVEILDRIAVGIELEPAAQRSEVGLLQCSGPGFIVGEVAFDRLDGAVDQHRSIISLEGVGAGYAVVGGLIGGDEFLVLRIVQIGCPVRAAEHADRGVLLRRQRRFIDRERREDWHLICWSGLPLLLHPAYALSAWLEGLD